LSTHLQKRYRRQRWFVAVSRVTILLALLFLVGLIVSIVGRGWSGFFRGEVQITVALPETVLENSGKVRASVYKKLIHKALLTDFEQHGITDAGSLENIIGFQGALKLRQLVRKDPDSIGRTITTWLPAGKFADGYLKGDLSTQTLVELQVEPDLIRYFEILDRSNKGRMVFNWSFFTLGDSSQPDTAGIGGALAGSFYMLLLTFVLSFPTAILAAVYLELFAPKNRWFDLVEININNLAAVPSIIFGLLGLAVFINLMGVPRSTPLVGGMVLALMTLPTIVISARAAIKAVPETLLAGAMSLGATRMQGVFHHVLPAAMPGVLTGTIIGMAQALGETAPLILIGMVAFIHHIPAGPMEAATALPVQIYLWADNPLRGFAERSAAAIMVLLAFLMIMNISAVLLRKKLEVKW